MRRLPRPLLIGLSLAALAPLAFAKGGDPGKGKDKGKASGLVVPGEAKTGHYHIDLSPSYVDVAVPKTYDAKQFWPVLFVLHPMDIKPDDFVGAWAETPLGKSWIVASWYAKEYFCEDSVTPLQTALAQVKATYHVDDRRVVLAGHNGGANMAWCLLIADPSLWAGIVSLAGGVADEVRPNMAKLAGKPAYVFRGSKDGWFTQTMLDRDKKFLESFRVPLTVEVKEGWDEKFPRGNTDAVVKWIESIWPPGLYREKTDEAAKAVEAGDFKAAASALEAVAADLKKHPYPAFEPRRQSVEKAFLDAGHEKIAEGKKLLDAGQPLEALERADANAKAFKGIRPLEADATAALETLRRNDAVKEAVRKKEAEATASTYMEKATAAEAKGDLAKALEWYRKVVALGDTSKKGDASKKVAEIEPQVPAK